jgi:hypothetical protein
MGVGLAARPGVQLNLIELLTMRREDERVNTVRAETPKNFTSMCEESQRALLQYHDKIKLKGLGTNFRDGDTFISDDERRSGDATLYKSDADDDDHSELIVNMLDINESGEKERDKEMKGCKFKVQLTTPETEVNTETGSEDIRALSIHDLRMKVDESDNLTHEQKKDLFSTVLKYKAHFSSKPRLCKIFEYEFEVQCSEPVVGHTRQIPFSVRPAVREQIRQIMADNVLEISTSSYVNSLTILLREGKEPRICTDARAVNRHIVPDRARVAPIQEMLQQFHGSKFITSIDLSSAFLQIGLKKECRKYTSFLFDSQLYQYTRCPYGFKNTLSAFVRALQLTLGSDTNSYAVAYIDDIVVHSPSFELHLKHLDTVMGRLTQAWFSINAKKCKFSKTEISFLGHVVRQVSVSPDPRRIEAVLSYPAPRNQRQLRQFLGTCNYHHRFIINYADYLAPLLPLLKKRE